MSEEFQIKVSQMQGRVPVTVFHIKGQIDANTSKDLQAKATESIGAGAGNILLDLSEVSYMASAGFRAIHAIYKALAAGDEGSRPQHLKLLNPSPEVGRIIKTMGFDAYVTSHKDLKQAVASF